MLDGNRIEVTAPGLKVGDDVEVIVLSGRRSDQNGVGVADFLKSLPPNARTAEEWEALERDFQTERDAWDR
ncbi:MAG: hypothetical protein ABIP55_10770 [Tepidisphaeraceae bacterium]